MSDSIKHYTLDHAYHTDGCETKFKGKSGTGRFNSKSPSASARKAFSSLCQRKKIKGRCSMLFSVRETTQGSKHKVFNFAGHRVLKEVPSPYGHKYDIKVKRITPEEMQKKTCKASRKSRGRMKSKRSKLLTKRKFSAPGSKKSSKKSST